VKELGILRHVDSWKSNTNFILLWRNAW